MADSHRAEVVEAADETPEVVVEETAETTEEILEPAFQNKKIKAMPQIQISD